MISDHEVKRAMNRLANVFPPPRDPEGTLDEWRRALRDPWLNLHPAELEDAVSTYIAQTEDSFGYPRPAQITSIVKAGRGTEPYTEPKADAPPAPKEAIREAWKAAGIDLAELRRLNRKRRDRGAA